MPIDLSRMGLQYKNSIWSPCVHRTTLTVRKRKVTVEANSLIRLDFAPLKFSLFAKLNESPKGQHCLSISDFEFAVRNPIKRDPEFLFSSRMKIVI